MNMRNELTHDIGETIIGASIVVGMLVIAVSAGSVFGLLPGLGVVGVGIAGFMWCMCCSAGRGDKRAQEMTDAEFRQAYPLDESLVDVEEMDRMYKVVAR